MRPPDVAGGRGDEFRADPDAPLGWQQGARQDHVNREVAGETIEVERRLGVARRLQRRAHHQRLEAGERAGQGIGEARAEIGGVGIWLERPERQDGEPQNRPRIHDLAAVDHGQGRAQIGGERLGRRISLDGRLAQCPVEHPIGGGHGRRAGQDRRRVVHHGVGQRRQRGASERRAAGEHLEGDDRRREQIGAGVDGGAGELLGRGVLAACRRTSRRPCSGWPVTSPGSVERTGEAEVEQLDAGRARGRCSTGFRSRCTMAWPCSTARASRMATAVRRASAGGSAPRARRSASDSPATSSIAMKRRSPASPRS